MQLSRSSESLEASKRRQSVMYARKISFKKGVFELTPQPIAVLCGVNTFTAMPHHSASDKTQALKAAGTFNARSKQVHHHLFEASAFFDPCDLPQLKYEALRAIRRDDYSITQAADEFGLSRPTLYHAQEQFDNQGLEGLLARKRGPKRAHKLTPEVCQYLIEQTAAQPTEGARQLAQRVNEKFKIRLHPRTIEKALKTKGKRGLQTPS